MNHNIFYIREKEYLKLVRRQREIQNIKFNMPKVLLDKPYQNGWVAELAILPEILKGFYNEPLQEVLDICSSSFYISRNKSKLISEIRKCKNFKRAKSLFYYKDSKGKPVYCGPELKSINNKKYEKLTDRGKKYFDIRYHTHINRWGGQDYIYTTYYPLIPEHWLYVRIKKNMITHKGGLDCELEQELAEINSKIDDYRQLHNRHRDWYNKRKSINRREVRDGIIKFKKGELNKNFVI